MRRSRSPVAPVLRDTIDRLYDRATDASTGD